MLSVCFRPSVPALWSLSMPSFFRRSFVRLAGAGLACTTLFAAHATPAFAAECGNSPAHEAFDVAGLKSELMVTALSCKSQDRYNAFVAKFRPSLLDAEKRLDGYFRSTYGRRAQAAHDDYITQLADVQSLGGLKSGTVFCEQRTAMFDEIDALESASDLAHYAEAKDVAQPASYESCAAPATVDRRPRHGTTKSTTTRRTHRA
ncbi:MAG: hypothetical protein ABF542_00545 [Gluconobacter sp.]